jgi:hypothetical protein
MTVRTSAHGCVVIVGPLSLILTVWACGGSSSASGLSSGDGSASGRGSNTFGMGDDASGGSASSSGGLSRTVQKPIAADCCTIRRQTAGLKMRQIAGSLGPTGCSR